MYLRSHTQQSYLKYKEHRIEMKVVKKANGKTWNKFGEIMENNSRKKTILFYKIRSIRKNRKITIKPIENKKKIINRKLQNTGTIERTLKKNYLMR